jgi:hypothetical protein
MDSRVNKHNAITLIISNTNLPDSILRIKKNIDVNAMPRSKVAKTYKRTFGKLPLIFR